MGKKDWVFFIVTLDLSEGHGEGQMVSGSNIFFEYEIILLQTLLFFLTYAVRS